VAGLQKPLLTRLSESYVTVKELTKEAILDKLKEINEALLKDKNKHKSRTEEDLEEE